MCGIAGIFNLNGAAVSPELLHEMNAAVTHRGPDDGRCWSTGCVGLAHRRLAVIDLSELGAQPMQSDDSSLVISYNGEVYNFTQLRAELEQNGHRFRSSSDTEVILNAYREWGESCVERFNGMFAFALWDARQNKLVLARDRYGIKPLYYTLQQNVFVFGSEIKSLLKHPLVSVRVNPVALNEYFSFQNIFSDETLFAGIQLLPAGTVLTVKGDDRTPVTLRRYWDFDFTEDSPVKTGGEYLEELDYLFRQAVKRQLISDVEIGCYLSGGMDSGAITCLASQYFKNLKTFTCGFDLTSASGMEIGFDERAKAELLSGCFKTEQYEVVLKAGDMERVMEQLVWHLEDLRVGQSYPNYYVARLASKFVKVVISGTGGDELFAGYPWRYYRAVLNDDTDDYIDKYYSYWQRLVDDSMKPQLFRPEVYAEMDRGHTKDVFRAVMNGNAMIHARPEDYVNRSLYFESKTFLHGLLLMEDKLSMANGLETRLPFLDNDLVDFAMKVPVRLKLRGLTDMVEIDENDPQPKVQKYFQQTNDGKILLRRMLSRYVPEQYSNGIKQGFSAPDAGWFKGQSIDYIKQLLFDKRARIYQYLQPTTTMSLLNDHFEGRTNRRLLIWSLLCFEWWNRIFDPRVETV